MRVRTAVCCYATGLVMVLCAILAPLFLDKTIDNELCDALCIPTPTSPKWKYDAWLTSDNTSSNPVTFQSFWLHNITNHKDVITGTKPEIRREGPYVYKVRYEKFNVSFAPNDYFVDYELSTEYEFQPNLSQGLETDLIWTVNLPFVAGAQLLYSLSGQPLSKAQQTLCGLQGETGDNQACLFGRRTVSEVLWSQHSSMIELSSETYFPDRPLNPNFQLNYRCLNAEDCYERSIYRGQYGLGGKCALAKPGGILPLAGLYCKDPKSTAGSNMAWRQYTGHRDLQDMGTLMKWMGNWSVWCWNGTCTDPDSFCEHVSGSDRNQFHPRVSKTETLKIWEPAAMRSFSLSYQREVEFRGVSMYRFVPSADIYAGTDHRYFNTMPGFLNLTAVASVAHGAPSPILSSRWYMMGAKDKWRKAYTCLNCPDIVIEDRADSGSADNSARYESMYGSYLDLEPNTGKTLRGTKRFQLNVHIGQSHLFDGHGVFASRAYANVPETILPIVSYSISAEMNEEQAIRVREAVTQLHIAGAFKIGAWVAGLLGGAALLISMALFIAQCNERLQEVISAGADTDNSHSASALFYHKHPDMSVSEHRARGRAGAGDRLAHPPPETSHTVCTPTP